MATLKRNPEEYLDTTSLEADLKRRAVRGGTWTIAGQGAKFVTQTAGTVILARLLFPADFGLVAMVTALLGFMEVFKDLGLSAATIQRPRINHGQVSTLFWINGGLGVLMSAIGVSCSPLIAAFYGEPRLVLVASGLSVSFLINGFTIQHQAILRRRMHFVRLTIIEYVSVLCGVVSGIISAMAGLSYWALVIYPLASSVAFFASTWVACGWRPGPPVRHSGVRQMLRFGGNLTGFSVVNYLARNMDNILIGKAWGKAELGFYDKAYQLFLLPLNQLNRPLSSIAIPALSRMSGDPERYRRISLKLIDLLAMFTMPAIALMVVTADWLILFVLGEQWMGSVPIFVLLGIAGITQPVNNAIGWLFITQDRTKEMFQVGCITSIIAVLTFIIGLPYGAVGVAAAYAIGSVVIRTPIQVYIAGQRGNVSTSALGKILAINFVPAATVGGSVYGLRVLFDIQDPVVGLLGGFLSGFAITLAIWLAIPHYRRNLKEIRLLSKELKRH